MSHLAVLRLHVTQIFFVVGKDGLTLGTRPFCGTSGLAACARWGRVTPGGRVVLVAVVVAVAIVVVVVVVILLLLLLLLPPPVLSVGILRSRRRLGLEDSGSGRVGRGGVSGLGLGLCLFDRWSSVSRLERGDAGKKSRFTFT